MNNPAYLIGHLTVKDPKKWALYREAVPATLIPWGGALLFRGKVVEVLAGSHTHSDSVVIRFPDRASLDGWHTSSAYQALVPLREAASDGVLIAYAT